MVASRAEVDVFETGFVVADVNDVFFGGALRALLVDARESGVVLRVLVQDDFGGGFLEYAFREAFRNGHFFFAPAIATKVENGIPLFARGDF
jgi:hypothetical protein